MAPPTSYDPESLDEQPIPLPNAALIQISSNIVLQPPLSRRGTGPGIIIFLPDPVHLVLADQNASKPLDPDPITKWAEEGFAVVAIASSDEVPSVTLALKEALTALQALEQVDIKQKFAVIGGYHKQMIVEAPFNLFFSSISLRSENPVCRLRGCRQGISCCNFCGLRVVSCFYVPLGRPNYVALD